MSAVDESTIDKNYKIPKRKSDEISNDGNSSSNEYNSSTNNENPVMANSYYNYYENSGLFGPWQQGAIYSHYPSTNTVEPITQNIYNTLSHIKERPKNHRKDIFKETVPDVDDPTLPKELTSMFQPLYCKLCTAQLSSNVMAKLHYKSKNHEKKIRKFLIEHSQKTGEPLHKRARMAGTSKSEEDTNPCWFHCDVCDLPLTGKMHAESHYMGKNHQRALVGYKPPAGKGHYNEEGKWVRQLTKKAPPLAPGEDNFGLDFRAKKPEQPKPVPVVTTPKNPQSKFHCDICNVGATCQEQIEMHFKGQKHQKKMRQMGLQPHFTSLSPTANQASTTESNFPPKSVDVNLSVYRTPSGDFYCPTCNLTLSIEPQFKIHLRSKGHMKQFQLKH